MITSFLIAPLAQLLVAQELSSDIVLLLGEAELSKCIGKRSKVRKRKI